MLFSGHFQQSVVWISLFHSSQLCLFTWHVKCIYCLCKWIIALFIHWLVRMCCMVSPSWQVQDLFIFCVHSQWHLHCILTSLSGITPGGFFPLTTPTYLKREHSKLLICVFMYVKEKWGLMQVKVISKSSSMHILTW